MLTSATCLARGMASILTRLRRIATACSGDVPAIVIIVTMHQMQTTQAMSAVRPVSNGTMRANGQGVSSQLARCEGRLAIAA